MFYTHLSDQYSPFSTTVVNVGVRDATYVLDGLLYHESDLRIEEHYTDTAGFTDHVFGMMHLLGFKFAPRIRDLNETRLFVPRPEADYPALKSLIGGKINLSHLKANWEDLLRLAPSIRQGTVTASLILRKLAAYPRQNGLALALRELGRIERTIFILTWLQSTELRRRAMPDSTKARPATPWRGQSSSTASAKSGTAASTSSVTAPAISASSSPPSSSGTPPTCSAASNPSAGKMPLMMTSFCNIRPRWAENTSI